MQRRTRNRQQICVAFAGRAVYKCGMTLTKTAKCPKCGAPNQWLDARTTGARLRSERERAGLSGAQVGNAMGISRAYVSALELGEREWTDALVGAYMTALATASKEAR